MGKKQVYLLLVLLAGCVSGGKTAETPYTFTLQVVNNSRFDIELIDDTRVVPAHSEKTLILPRYTGEVDGGYSLTYRVKLLDGVYITIRRDENVVVTAEQKTLVIENAAFPSSETFMVLHNKSIHTVRARTDEGFRRTLEQTGSGQRQYGSANIAAGASALFDNIPSRIALSVESDNKQSKPFPFIIHRPGYIYAYTFDGANVALVDARPLHAIGEPSAVQTLPALPEAVDRAIEASIPRTEMYAYRELHALAPRDGGVLLAVGEADERGGFGREAKAYICDAAESGVKGSYTIRWEHGPQDLDPALGPAVSAYYDGTTGTYRILGELLEYDSQGNRLPANYVIELDEAGTLARSAVTVKDTVLTKIIGDAAGTYYLAGEVVDGGRSAAVVLKYGGEGLVWKTQANVPRNSYVQDALFDEDENQIVLAGVQDGATGAGDGGTPFIRGMSAETGEVIWHSELTAAPFRQTALVYRIEKTASGYRVVLCGISESRLAPPYLEATVNVRGQFIEAVD
jgi:hypothetical protein